MKLTYIKWKTQEVSDGQCIMLLWIKKGGTICQLLSNQILDKKNMNSEKISEKKFGPKITTYKCHSQWIQKLNNTPHIIIIYVKLLSTRI